MERQHIIPSSIKPTTSGYWPSSSKIDAFRRQTLRKGRFAYCSVSCVVLPRQGIDPCVLADVVTHLGGYGAAPRDRRRVPLEVPVSPSSGPSERAAA